MPPFPTTHHHTSRDSRKYQQIADQELQEREIPSVEYLGEFVVVVFAFFFFFFFLLFFFFFFCFFAFCEASWEGKEGTCEALRAHLWLRMCMRRNKVHIQVENRLLCAWGSGAAKRTAEKAQDTARNIHPEGSLCLLISGVPGLRRGWRRGWLVLGWETPGCPNCQRPLF